MTVSIPADFNNLLDNYIPATSPEHDEVWDAFVAKYGITPNTDLNGTITIASGETLTLQDSKAYHDYIIQQGLPTNFDPDSFVTDKMQGSYYWYKFLASQGLATNFRIDDLPDLALPISTQVEALTQELMMQNNGYDPNSSVPMDDQLAKQRSIYRAQVFAVQFENYINTLGPTSTTGAYYWQQFLSSQNLPSNYDITLLPAQAQLDMNKAFNTYTSNAIATFYKDVQAYAATTDTGYGLTVSVKQLFNSFITKKYQEIAGESLSLDEIKSRTIIFSVMDILLLLMQTAQENAAVVQNTILYLAKVQKQYNAEMAAITFYRGESDNIGTVNTTDLSLWTLGYANISMQDYLLSAIVPRIPNPTDPNSPSGYQALHLNADGKGDVPVTATVNSPIPVASPVTITPDMKNSLDFIATDTNLKITYNMKVPHYVWNGSGFSLNNDEIPITKTITFDPTDSVDTKLEKAKTGFQQLLAQNTYTYDGITYTLTGTMVNSTLYGTTLGDYITDPRMPLHTSWDNQLNRPYDQDNGGTKAQTRGGQARAAKNQVLQQFLENARSRKEVVSNFQDTMETTFDSAKDSLSRTTDIINSAIQQLSNIVTSIFRIV